MNNLCNIMEEHPNKDYYDSIPVAYCKNCLSLKIMRLNDSLDYCDECGSTDIELSDIVSWEDIHKQRYHKSFINK